MIKLFTIAMATVVASVFSFSANAACTKTWPNGVEYIHPCGQMPAPTARTHSSSQLQLRIVIAPRTVYQPRVRHHNWQRTYVQPQRRHIKRQRSDYDRWYRSQTRSFPIPSGWKRNDGNCTKNIRYVPEIEDYICQK